MTDDVLRHALQAVMQSGLAGDNLTIVWHSGEPLTVPIGFYHEANRIIAEECGSTKVDQSLQTNGVLIDDAWCDLFTDYGIRVGVSLDGPARFHDRHRTDWNKKSTHARVLRGIDTLQRRDIPFHVICVVTNDALDHGAELIDFFVDVGVEEVGFNFEELEAANESSSISGADVERARMFWEVVYARNNQLGRPLRIREFARALKAITSTKMVERTRMGNEQARPFGIISVDYEGRISSFSPELLGARHSRFESFIFGDVSTGLSSVLNNHTFQTVAREIAQGVQQCAKTCAYYTYCGGGAPVNKLFENGTFDSTETTYCKTAVQAPIEIMLSDLERQLGLSQQVIKASAQVSHGRGTDD